jgi:hypothetical protein
MFVVSKPAKVRTEIIDVPRIVRVCPLSPRISGPAILGVTPETALDSYNSFYVNKYYCMRDFVFMNGL